MIEIFKKHKVFGVCIFLVVLANLYSFIPLFFLYIQPVPQTVELNQQIVPKLSANKGDNFEFIVISDTSSGLFVMEATTLKVVSRINKEDRFKGKIDIDFVMNVGDVTFRGKEDHYKNYAKIKERIKFPVITAIGNHDDDIDDGPSGQALFNKYCGETEFAFVDRNSYFIVLDNKIGNLTDQQFDWLESQLKASQKYAHVFVFMHKPPFNPYQQSWYRQEQNSWSYKFMKMCEEYNVDMVFSGHEYVSKIVDFGGVKYVVTGGAGALLFEAPAWDNAFNHYVVVKVNGDYLDYEIRQVWPPIWQYTFLYFWKDLYYVIKQCLN